MAYLYKFLGLITLCLVISCGGSGGGNNGGSDDDDMPIAVDPPTAATLQSPANNEVCTTGVSINDSQSQVDFEWSDSENTDSYTISITNLESNTTANYNSSINSTAVTLEKGQPYSWYVTSKSNETSETADSSIWKFYLEGNGEINYAPFPASLISPANESTLIDLIVTLSWSGADVDNDIVSYDVYLDNSDASTLLGNTANTSISSGSLFSGSTYYWKVVTIDALGNTSESLVYTFYTEDL